MILLPFFYKRKLSYNLVNNLVIFLFKQNFVVRLEAKIYYLEKISAISIYYKILTISINQSYESYFKKYIHRFMIFCKIEVIKI